MLLRLITSIISLLLQAQPAAAAPPKSLIVAVCQAGDQMVMIDPEAMKVIGSVPTGVGPHEVIASRDGKTAYVANYGNGKTVGNSLLLVDLVAKKAIKTVDLSPLKRPHGLAVDDQGRVIFTSETSCAIGRYDPQKEKLDAIVGTGQAVSHMVARDPSSGKIYTANIFGNSITMIDFLGKPNKPVTLAVHMQPEGIAISPDGKQLWVGHRQGGDIAVIDTAKMKITDTIDCGGVPIRLAFSSDGSKVLVSEAESGNVIVYDASSKKELGRVEVGQTPVGIAIAPDGKHAAVSTTGDGNIVIFDIDAMKVLGKVQVGKNPDGIAWTTQP